MDDFARAFHQADEVFVTDIYAASEEPIEGVNAEVLVNRIREHGHRAVHFIGELGLGERAIAAEARDGDLILTLGAGSVSHAGERLLQALGEKP